MPLTDFMFDEKVPGFRVQIVGHVSTCKHAMDLRPNCDDYDMLDLSDFTYIR